MVSEDRVKSVIAQCLGLDVDKIYPDASFESLGADYLDILGLFISLEEEFGIEISERDANQMKTVKDINWYIQCIFENEANKKSKINKSKINKRKEGNFHVL